jgi:hypothetical protein
MNAISHSQELINIARELKTTGEQYRDYTIDDCAVQIGIRYAIIRLRRINGEIDHECEKCGELLDD